MRKGMSILVVAHVERVLDDAADQLRREEVGELRGEGRGEGVEVEPAGCIGLPRASPPSLPRHP